MHSSSPRAPSARSLPLRIQVPGSTSNLGPGFDLLGLAVSLHLEVRLAAPQSTSAGGHTFTRTGPFAEELSGEAEERVVQAFELAASHLELGGAFHFEVTHGIPVGRGMGSSGAATAAGLLLARALSNREVGTADLIAWGIELEGHPDNVTASLLGGCTLCHPDPDGLGPAYIQSRVHESIRVALAWPAQPLETARARSALPITVAHSDAVENPRRLALLLEGLRIGDARLLRAGGEDRLHVERRLALIPGAAAGISAATDAGAWLATISGAGSGLVALGSRERIRAIAQAMALAFRSATGFGDARVVDVVHGAASAVAE